MAQFIKARNDCLINIDHISVVGKPNPHTGWAMAYGANGDEIGMVDADAIASGARSIVPNTKDVAVLSFLDGGGELRTPIVAWDAESEDHSEWQLASPITYDAVERHSDYWCLEDRTSSPTLYVFRLDITFTDIEAARAYVAKLRHDDGHAAKMSADAESDMPLVKTH